MPPPASPSSPPSWSNAPLRPEDQDAPLSLGLVLRAATPLTPFIVLRQTFGATVFLGCSRDRAGTAQALLEIWVQEPPAPHRSLRGPVLGGNGEADAAWRHLVDALTESAGASLVRTGWEDAPLPPIRVDVTPGRAHPVNDPESGGRLEVCTNDAALAKAGLPPYPVARQRLLWDRTAAEKPRFYRFARAGDDVAGEGGVSLLPDDWRVFNPHGGWLLVRPYAPVCLVAFADLLTGQPLEANRAWLPPLPAALAEGGSGSEPPASSSLLHGRHSPEDRALEVLFLKLDLIKQTLERLHAHTRAHRRPFLGLGAESFRVAWPAGARELPSAWTAEVHLVDVPAAFPISLAGVEAPYYVRPEPVVASVYQPRSVAGYHRGTAGVRLREAVPVDGGKVSLELTLLPEDALQTAATDLLRVSLPSEAGSLEVYGHPDTLRGLGPGELRLRSFPMNLAPSSAAWVQRSAGVPLSAVPYERLPQLSSPYDGYAVAVLACRLLFVGPGLPLPVAVDELLSLASTVSAPSAASAPLAERITHAFVQDERWARTLGPQRLRADGMPDHAIPRPFWAEVLAAILRLLPGAVPESHCQDWGDAPPLAPERAHEGALAEFRSLCTVLRGWVLRETAPNRELRAVIDDLRTREGR